VTGLPAHCPCGGGGGGDSDGAAIWFVLGLVVVLWQLTRWTARTWNSEGVTHMARVLRVTLMVVLAAGMVVVVAGQFRDESSVAAEPATQAKPLVERSGVPTLIDLGSTECIPCKLMWPVLEEMKKEFAG